MVIALVCFPLQTPNTPLLFVREWWNSWVMSKLEQLIELIPLEANCSRTSSKCFLWIIWISFKLHNLVRSPLVISKPLLGTCIYHTLTWGQTRPPKYSDERWLEPFLVVNNKILWRLLQDSLNRRESGRRKWRKLQKKVEDRVKLKCFKRWSRITWCLSLYCGARLTRLKWLAKERDQTSLLLPCSSSH